VFGKLFYRPAESPLKGDFCGEIEFLKEIIHNSNSFFYENE